MSQDLDTTRLRLLLNELRLPAVKQVWPRFAERSDKEGWPAARFLMSLAEHEIAERDRRRIERHLAEAKLLPGKTLENFDFAAVPMISKAQVSALCEGDGWLRNGTSPKGLFDEPTYGAGAPRSRNPRGKANPSADAYVSPAPLTIRAMRIRCGRFQAPNQASNEVPRGALSALSATLQRPARTGIPVPRPYHRRHALWPHLHGQAQDQSEHRLRRTENRRQGGQR